MPKKLRVHNPFANSRVHQVSRPCAARRGYGRKWRKFRARFLMENPLCADCQDAGKTEGAHEVHHIKKHRGDPALLYDDDNCTALCKSCHSKRTGEQIREKREKNARRG